MPGLRPLNPWKTLATAVLFATAFTGCNGEVPEPGAGNGDGSKKRIVILTNGPDPFWDTCEAGAKAAEKELGLAEKGYLVDFQRGNFTDKAQIDLLKQYKLDPSVVAVGISSYNPKSRAIATEMKELRDKGVKVITIDGDMDREKFRDSRYAYLGTDNVVGGKELGRAAKALDEDGAKFAFFVGNVGAANAIERMDGFVEGAGDSFEELSRLDDGGDRPKARKNVEETVNNFPDVEMLVGIWAYNTPQAVAVVKDRQLRDKMKVVCFDAAEASIREMAAGNVDVMVAQNPYQMGFEGVRLMHAMVAEDQGVIDEMLPGYEQSGEKDIFRTELRVIVPDEGSPITKDLFEKDTIFFNLTKFKEWLGERGLVSS